VPASDACLDAETLAAWIDDGLDPAAVAQAEAHVSSCARCQALVGGMARGAPEVPVSGHLRSSFWRWWLAPVAAAAAATLVWMVVPDARYTAPPTPPTAEVAQAPSERFVNEPQSPAPLAAPPPAAVSPRPTSDARRETAAAAPAEARKTLEQTVSTEASARSAKPTTDAQEQRAAPAPPTFRADLTAARDVASPDPAVRWRIRAGGVVDYTPDDGRTWERAATGVTTEIVAGSSPAPQVCWLVGPGGLVLVSTDGRTFARVSTPVEADLVGIHASDARTSVATAGDGRVFQTDDGGRTWRLRQ
jgi:hypothetical protein